MEVISSDIIEDLLRYEDLEVVQAGLNFWKQRSLEFFEFYRALLSFTDNQNLPLNEISQILDFNHLRKLFGGYPHKTYLALWVLGELVAFGAMDIVERNSSSLDLSDSKLSCLPENIGKLQYLRRLNLSDNQFTSVPKQMLELSDLEELNISKNSLSSLPSDLSRLENLRVLDLSGNRLKRFPAVLSEFPYLEVLNLEDNELLQVLE